MSRQGPGCPNCIALRGLLSPTGFSGFAVSARMPCSIHALPWYSGRASRHFGFLGARRIPGRRHAYDSAFFPRRQESSRVYLRAFSRHNARFCASPRWIWSWSPDGLVISQREPCQHCVWHWLVAPHVEGRALTFRQRQGPHGAPQSFSARRDHDVFERPHRT